MSAIVLNCPELTFDPDAHIYRLNGDRIPGVTELMRPLSDNVYRFIDQNTLDIAAARGSAVHEAIENFAKFGIKDCEPEHKGYFDGFLAWVKAERVEIEASEIAIYHKALRYAGTIDLICNVHGARWLIDVKTTAQVNEMLTNVQLSAYGAAVASHDIRIDRKAVLHLKTNGKYRINMADTTRLAEGYVVFGNLIAVNRYVQKYKKG